VAYSGREGILLVRQLPLAKAEEAGTHSRLKNVGGGGQNELENDCDSRAHVCWRRRSHIDTVRDPIIWVQHQHSTLVGSW
jgi:hypothetical protein